MSPRSGVAHLLPVLPVLAGGALSAMRFRLHDSMGGLGFGLGGVLLMVVIAIVRDRD